MSTYSYTQYAQAGLASRMYLFDGRNGSYCRPKSSKLNIYICQQINFATRTTEPTAPHRTRKRAKRKKMWRNKIKKKLENYCYYTREVYKKINMPKETINSRNIRKQYFVCERRRLSVFIENFSSETIRRWPYYFIHTHESWTSAMLNGYWNVCVNLHFIFDIESTEPSMARHRASLWIRGNHINWISFQKFIWKDVVSFRSINKNMLYRLATTTHYHKLDATNFPMLSHSATSFPLARTDSDSMKLHTVLLRKFYYNRIQKVNAYRIIEQWIWSRCEREKRHKTDGTVRDRSMHGERKTSTNH